jgi:hypothetical protein
MAQEKSGIELVREINQKWLAKLEEDKSLYGILMNEPFSNDYWTEKYKIVLCNLESYDQSKTEKLLDLKCFKEWLENNNRTIRRSAIFICCLYSELSGNDIDQSKLDAIKKNTDLLLDTINKITYMNLLKDAKPNRQFDRKYFWDFFEDVQNRNNTIDLINALGPDVFIISSDDGGALMEQLFNKKFENHMFVHGKTLFAYIPHPSLISDNAILERVHMIKEKLKTHNL